MASFCRFRNEFVYNEHNAIYIKIIVSLIWFYFCLDVIYLLCIDSISTHQSY